MSEVDYCITTMDRPGALERLLLSIAGRCPEATVHVADQSGRVDSANRERLTRRLSDAGLRQPPTFHRLPFDCGVSAARNHLADSTSARYALFLDDDFVFGERTDVDAMARLLNAHRTAGVVGGSVSRQGRVRNVGTLLRKDGESLRQLAITAPFEEHEGIRFRQAECVPMFALMRRELFAHVRWDPALKTAAEHFDFFLRVAPTPFAVLHTPDAVVDHPPTETSPAYAQLRLRGELLARMLRKHEVVRLKTVERTVFELGPEGELIGYCELTSERPNGRPTGTR
jgi:GT2 family glycosyltransferase